MLPPSIDFWFSTIFLYFGSSFLKKKQSCSTLRRRRFLESLMPSNLNSGLSFILASMFSPFSLTAFRRFLSWTSYFHTSGNLYFSLTSVVQIDFKASCEWSQNLNWLEMISLRIILSMLTRTLKVSAFSYPKLKPS